MTNLPQVDTRRLIRRAEALRARLLRRWVARVFRRLSASVKRFQAEAELRAMDERELHDLGLDRGGIAHAARWGRRERGRGMEHSMDRDMDLGGNFGRISPGHG